jgi:hypothetical protein
MLTGRYAGARNLSFSDSSSLDEAEQATKEKERAPRCIAPVIGLGRCLVFSGHVCEFASMTTLTKPFSLIDRNQYEDSVQVRL